MNCDDQGLSINQRLDLIASERAVERLMGAEPIPSLDIDKSEI